MTTKDEGAYPGADPTAPGGMSRANLRIELREKHGISMEGSREMSWPDLIQAVIDGRLAREAEAKVGTVVKPATEADEPGNYYPSSPLALDDMFEAEEGEFPDHDPGCSWVLHDETCTCGADDIDMFGPAMNGDFDGPGKKDGTSDLDLPQPDDEEGEVFDPEALFEEMLSARAADEAANPPLFLGIPGIKDYVFDGHAGAGPSASERWMTCTMSLSLSREFLETLSPNQQRTFAGANLAARQGTTAHAVGEAKANHMLGRIDDNELEATLLELAIVPEDEGEAYDDEMDEYVNEYVDLIRSYADERGVEHVHIETRVEAAIPLANLHEGEVYIIRGSADVTVDPTPEEPTLVVGDLKYGEGIYVDAEENSQAMIYALGKLGELIDDEGELLVPIEKIILIIAQPRLGGIKVWELTLDDLLDWRDDVLSPALTEALYGEAEGAKFNPSEKACQFCPARGTCPALTEQRVSAAAEAFDVIVDAEFADGPGAFPETTGLSSEQLGRLLSQIGGLTSIYKDLKEEAQRRLHRGTPVPGYQLVNYTPPRKWKEIKHSDLVKAVGATTAKKLYKEPTLITPKQATVLLGERADMIKALYDTPEKRPVVAPEGDRRSAWTGKPPEAMFPDDVPEVDTRAAEEMFPDD